MCERDKDTYRNDPCGIFCVTVNGYPVLNVLREDFAEKLVSDCVDNLIYLNDDREMDGEALSAPEAEAAVYIRKYITSDFSEDEKNALIEKALEWYNAL